jgi:hypothetical protein
LIPTDRRLPEHAGTEDRQVLRLQQSALLIRAFEDFHKLTEIVGELEQTAPHSELRVQIEALFPRTTKILWDQIDRVRTKIDTARERRTSASVENRRDIEDQSRQEELEKQHQEHGRCAQHHGRR